MALETLAAILAERKERTRLGLSKYTAEAAERAALHPDKLGITANKPVLNIGILTWAIPVRRAKESSEDRIEKWCLRHDGVVVWRWSQYH